MSKFYNPRRNSNLFKPGSVELYKISRSKIDSFLRCPRCFYLDVRLGVAQPPGYPFSLNVAVDKLLKREFDSHRAKGTAHPLMKTYKIDAVPFDHPDIEKWRNPRQGISYLHPRTNLFVYGAIDDIWFSKDDGLHIVDYKATSKDGQVNLDADWQIGYKRQVEIYQWLFRQNGFKVSNTAYFVYCNGDTDKEAFDGRLEFAVSILPYRGDASWLEQTLIDLYQCLAKNLLPSADIACDYCAYRQAVQEVEK